MGMMVTQREKCTISSFPTEKIAKNVYIIFYVPNNIVHFGSRKMVNYENFTIHGRMI